MGLWFVALSSPEELERLTPVRVKKTYQNN
jgi:hypothetical protein